MDNQILEIGKTYYLDNTECHRGVYVGKKENILLFDPLDKTGYEKDENGHVGFYDDDYKYKEVPNVN
jgi:hypothetical protein